MQTATLDAVEKIYPYLPGLIESEEELRVLWSIDNSEYDSSSLPWASFQRWWQNYDLGLTVIRSAGKIQAGMGIWSLDKLQTRLLIAGTLKEDDLVPLTVEQLDLEPTNFCYVSGIFTHNHGLNGMLRTLLNVGGGSYFNSTHVSYPCNVYALGYSDKGVALLERFGFEVIKSAAETADGMPLYWRSIQTPADFTLKR